MANDQVHGDQTPQDDPKPNSDGVTVEVLNKAISARLSAFEKAQKKQISEALESLAPTIDNLLSEKISAVLKQQSEPAPKDKSDVQNDPLFKGMQKQLTELKAKADEAEAKAAAQAKAAKESNLRQKVAEELSKAGLDAQRTRFAIGYLLDSEKRVRWSEDDEDSIVFKDSDGTDVDLVSGIRSWAKSEEAKIFLPPRGTVGSGERPIRQTSNKTGNMAREELGEALANLYRNGQI